MKIFGKIWSLYSFLKKAIGNAIDFTEYGKVRLGIDWKTTGKPTRLTSDQTMQKRQGISYCNNIVLRCKTCYFHGSGRILMSKFND